MGFVVLSQDTTHPNRGFQTAVNKSKEEEKKVPKEGEVLFLKAISLIKK